VISNDELTSVLGDMVTSWRIERNDPSSDDVYGIELGLPDGRTLRIASRSALRINVHSNRAMTDHELERHRAIQAGAA
jgi:hypothetical protein